MPLDLTDPIATSDAVAQARQQANAEAMVAIAPTSQALRAAADTWQAALAALLADPFSDTRRTTETDALQVLVDARTAYRAAVTAAKTARTLAVKTALGG
jgi:hypothetical protein